MYYRARWYDPGQGRFLTEDPIGFAGGLNLYAYVENDPVGESDPLGFQGEDFRFRQWQRSNLRENGRPDLADLLDGYRPFVISNFGDLFEQAGQGIHPGYMNATGDFECASLPQSWEWEQQSRLANFLFGSRRLTRNWRMGIPVTLGARIEVGTVLATFDRETGRYLNEETGNHTVIFAGWGLRGTGDACQPGMFVIETIHAKPMVSFRPFDDSAPYFRNPGRFNVVMIPMR